MSVNRAGCGPGLHPYAALRLILSVCACILKHGLWHSEATELLLLRHRGHVSSSPSPAWQLPPGPQAAARLPGCLARLPGPCPAFNYSFNYTVWELSRFRFVQGLTTGETLSSTLGLRNWTNSHVTAWNVGPVAAEDLLGVASINPSKQMVVGTLRRWLHSDLWRHEPQTLWRFVKRLKTYLFKLAFPSA